MGGDSFGLEGGAFRACDGQVLGEQVFHAISTQGFTARIGKEHIVGLSTSLSQPSA
jgi:hypothetical protein